jgi:hypothetical protein
LAWLHWAIQKAELVSWDKRRQQPEDPQRPRPATERGLLAASLAEVAAALESPPPEPASLAAGLDRLLMAAAVLCGPNGVDATLELYLWVNLGGGEPVLVEALGHQPSVRPGLDYGVEPLPAHPWAPVALLLPSDLRWGPATTP